MKEAEFVEKIQALGGKVYIVGGWVRDKIRKAAPHDKDYMVTGVEETAFECAFPHAKRVGKAFPVYLVDIDGEMEEVAFARREKKTGRGYKGFTMFYDPSTSVEDDLIRRDTRINSMAMELPHYGLIDPFHGEADIRERKICATSEHFPEDPVRALRAARQAAQFGFQITDETYAAMQACKEDLAFEPEERIYHELVRALATDKPSIFFLALKKAELLDVTFPELFALVGKSQPVAFHPEGDAFNHTMLVVDAVAAETDSIRARFAGLVHDLGKGTTPREMLPHHYGHEVRGLAVLARWNARMTLPKVLLEAGRLVIKEHMRATIMTKVGKQAKLLLKIARSTMKLEGFNAVIRADSHGLPSYLEQGAKYIKIMQAIDGRSAPKELKGPAIGRWIEHQQIKAFQRARQSGEK